MQSLKAPPRTDDSSRDDVAQLPADAVLKACGAAPAGLGEREVQSQRAIHGANAVGRWSRRITGGSSSDSSQESSRISSPCCSGWAAFSPWSPASRKRSMMVHLGSRRVDE